MEKKNQKVERKRDEIELGRGVGQTLLLRARRAQGGRREGGGKTRTKPAPQNQKKNSGKGDAR